MKKIASIALVALALTACQKNAENNSSAKAESKENDVVYSVETVKMTMSKMPLIVKASSSVQPNRESWVVSETQGKIRRVNFKLGQNVRKGQTLVSVNCGTQVAALKQAESTLETANLALEATNSMFAKQQASKMEALQAQNAVDGAKAGVEASREQVRNCTIRAPFSGKIAEKKSTIEKGSLLAGGAVVTRVVDINRLKTQIQISEREVTLLKKGQSVQMEIPALDNLLVDAEISAIAPASAPGTGSYAVEVQWKNTKEKNILPGMHVNLQVSADAEEDVLVVPYKALLKVRGVRGAYIAKDGIAAFKPVEIDRIRDDQAEVIKGLKENDIVIISGQKELKTGVKVKTTLVGKSGEVR